MPLAVEVRPQTLEPEDRGHDVGVLGVQRGLVEAVFQPLDGEFLGQLDLGGEGRVFVLPLVERADGDLGAGASADD